MQVWIVGRTMPPTAEVAAGWEVRAVVTDFAIAEEAQGASGGWIVGPIEVDAIPEDEDAYLYGTYYPVDEGG